MLDIYVDADACPVKPEVYRVAQRYGMSVTLVSNAWMRIPREDWLRLVVVDGQADAADDWIAARASEDDIVISGDIPLAARCLAKGSAVLDLRGGAFTADNIGEALASRELLSHLRDLGSVTGGPPSIGPRDRSRFLHRLDETVRAIRRRH
ncbi:MAG: YaiI/YqxD family protein [candidate division NC10 bacterium]|nr:YaiI/YqxD family protein [candidate division NC10 bacterium]